MRVFENSGIFTPHIIMWVVYAGVFCVIRVV